MVCVYRVIISMEIFNHLSSVFSDMYSNRGGLRALLHLTHYEFIERADWLLDREFLGFRKFLQQ